MKRMLIILWQLIFVTCLTLRVTAQSKPQPNKTTGAKKQTNKQIVKADSSKNANINQFQNNGSGKQEVKIDQRRTTIVKQYVREDKKTAYQKAKSSGFVSGLLTPPMINDPMIYFRSRNSAMGYPRSFFSQWEDPFSLISFDSVIAPFNFYVKINENRLYTNVSLTDRYGTFLGTISDKAYEFRADGNLYDFAQGDKFFEVLDRDHNIVFGMEFEPPNSYHIHGYFLRDSIIYVIDNLVDIFCKCESGYEKKITKRLKQIPYFNPYWRDGYRPY